MPQSSDTSDRLSPSRSRSSLRARPNPARKGEMTTLSAPPKSSARISANRAGSRIGGSADVVRGERWSGRSEAYASACFNCSRVKDGETTAGTRTGSSRGAAGGRAREFCSLSDFDHAVDSWKTSGLFARPGEDKQATVRHDFASDTQFNVVFTGLGKNQSIAQEDNVAHFEGTNKIHFQSLLRP